MVSETGDESGSLGLEVDLLGGFAVRVDGRSVPATAFARRRARTLLKLLALQPGYRLHRDQVLDLLWPDLDARAATGQRRTRRSTRW